MALSKAEIKTSFPLPVYNYRVTVLDGDNALTVSFSEVSGLSLEYEPVTYKHGFSFAMGNIILPGMQQPIRITLSRGVMKGGNLLHQWIKMVCSYSSGPKIKRDVMIDLCDESGDPVVRWQVQRAMPVKLDAPTFDANSSEVAIESLELVAHGLTVNYNP